MTGQDRTSSSRSYLHWPGSQPGWDFAACTLLIRSPKQQEHCQLMQSLKTGLLEGSASEDGSPGLLTNAPEKAHYIWSRGALRTGFADGSPQLSIPDQGDAVIPGCMNPVDVHVVFLMFPSPALTVMASMNWSLQECVPTTKARFVFLISLSTVLCCGNKDAQQLNQLLVSKDDLAVHCGLTDPFKTVEVSQALSYQLDMSMTGVEPTFSLDWLTQTSPEPACVPHLSPDKVPSSLNPASPEPALLLPSPAHRLLLLPAGPSCLSPSTPANQQLLLLTFLVDFTQPLLHYILLFLFQQPFPCTCCPLSPAL